MLTSGDGGFTDGAQWSQQLGEWRRIVLALYLLQ